MSEKTPALTGPPTYSQNAPDSDIVNATATLANLKLANDVVPSIDQCIAHLRLLEAFYNLREDVSTQDGLFGLKDSMAGIDSSRDESALFRIREKRWAVYVARAVERFTIWYQTCIPSRNNAKSSRPMKQPDIVNIKEFDVIPEVGHPLVFTKDNLPPLGMCF